MSAKVRTSVIGLGWPGKEHIKGYLADKEAELVAVCDWDEPVLRKVAREFNVKRTYLDYKEMIACEDIDAVSICVPNYEHAELTVNCLKAGNHVLCEKPPAMNPDEARLMAATARDAGKTLMYGLVMRFFPEPRFVKELILAGELGDIYLGKASYTRRRGIPLGKDGWFIDKSRSGGGALVDIGVHALDCVWYLMGTPRPVSVSGASYQKFPHCVPAGVKYDVDDASVALIKFDNGAALIVEASWAWNLPASSTKMVAGTKAGAQLDPLKLFTEKNGVIMDSTPGEKAMPEGYGSGPSNPFALEMAHFVDVIQGKQELIATPEHGIQLMQMLSAIYESAATGREVRL